MDARHAEFEDSSHSEKGKRFCRVSTSMPTIFIRTAESNFSQQRGFTTQRIKRQLKTNRAIKNNNSLNPTDYSDVYAGKDKETRKCCVVNIFRC